MTTSSPNFWKWLFYRTNGCKAGVESFIDWWLVLHFAIGLLAAIFLDCSFVDSAKNVIIPFASILTGITFAWSGNIIALLTTKELDEISKYHPNGISGYVFSVQRSILIIFVTLFLWVMVSLNIISNFFWRFLVFFFSSIAVRESWSVIMFAQMLTIYRGRVAETLKAKMKNHE